MINNIKHCDCEKFKELIWQEPKHREMIRDDFCSFCGNAFKERLPESAVDV